MTQQKTPAKRGPKPLPEGEVREARIGIRTHDHVKSEAERKAAAAGLSVSQWVERLILSAPG
jgi:predicted HicB family RNase H-like nuclease